MFLLDYFCSQRRLSYRAFNLVGPTPGCLRHILYARASLFFHSKLVLALGFRSRRDDGGHAPPSDSIENLRCVNFRPEKGEAQACRSEGKTAHSCIKSLQTTASFSKNKDCFRTEKSDSGTRFVPQVRPKFAIGEFCVWPEAKRLNPQIQIQYPKRPRCPPAWRRPPGGGR